MRIFFKNVNQTAFGVGVIDTTLTQNLQTQPHDHDFYEIFMVKHGALHHFLNQKSQLMRPGEICLIVPQDIHSFYCNEPNTDFINLSFPIKMLEQALVNIGLPLPEQHYLRLDQSQAQALQEKFNFLQQLICGREALKQTLSRHIIEEILLLLHSGNWDRDEIRSPFWLRKLISEMQKKESIQGGLNALITKSGKTQSHVTRCIKKYYGITPSQFIHRLRMEWACELLLSTNKPVIQICIEIGYQSVPYFNRQFQTYFHTTPTAFRKNGQSVV